MSPITTADSHNSENENDCEVISAAGVSVLTTET